MYILPAIMDESTFLYLTDEQRRLLCNASTEVILKYIREYIANPNANPEIVKMLNEVYATVFAREAYLNDEVLLDDVAAVKDVTYEMIGPGTPVESLRKWRDIIVGVLESDVATPYRNPIRKDAIEELIESVTESIAGADKASPELSALKTFKKNLVQYNRYFKDPARMGSTGTMVKFILRNKQKYEIIVNGINFMLEKKESGANPSSWRYL